jgi:capsule biosynthesis phosphatase
MGKRRIVVDVDDTILVTTTTRDYYNSTPLAVMIDKLNRLYDEGFEIVYFTARGQVSKNGDLDLIEKEVRPILEDWMDRHGVKRTSLIMGKPYADYYVDDKAMTPIQFLSATFDTQLSGRSGANLLRVGDEVVKTCSNATMQTEWIRRADDYGFSVPVVLSESPTGYRMDFIEGTPAWADVTTSTVRAMARFIEVASNLPPIPGYSGSFASYVKRSVRKLPRELQEKIADLSTRWESYCDNQQSFCHGDLTLDNMIDSPFGQIMIDPSVQEGIWSSWLIDVGRVLQSLEHRYEEEFKGAPVNEDKEFYLSWILSKLNVDRELADLQALLIYCRIWHHQCLHSTSDGEKTMDTIMKLIGRLGG